MYITLVTYLFPFRLYYIILYIVYFIVKNLQPELGSGLPSRWRPRPTLPGSRVTKREWRLVTLTWKKWRSRKKNHHKNLKNNWVYY